MKVIEAHYWLCSIINIVYVGCYGGWPPRYGGENISVITTGYANTMIIDGHCC